MGRPLSTTCVVCSELGFSSRGFMSVEHGTPHAGLYSLCASYLQSVGRGVRVECHVLRLEGCGAVALLQEDAAEGCGEYALAHVAARADEHYGV